MDKGEEKLLAVAWTYLYSVGIQIVDSAKHLRDKLGYLGKFSLFECYSLFVLVNEAFGKNVFFLMILSVIWLVLKNVGLKRRKGTFYFVPIVYLYFIYFIWWKKRVIEVEPLHLNYTLFLYKKNILSRLRTCTLLNKKTNSIQ